MKETNSTSFIVFCGLFILCVFISVAVFNIMPQNKESDSYYVKVDNDMTAKIEKIEVENDKLKVTASGDALEYCIKTTKSTPNANNICWKELEDNVGLISVYSNKKYYVWIKDINNNISNPESIKTD